MTLQVPSWRNRGAINYTRASLLNPMSLTLRTRPKTGSSHFKHRQLSLHCHCSSSSNCHFHSFPKLPQLTETHIMYNQLKRSRASLNGALSWRLGHRPGDQSRSSLSACLRQCFAKRSHGVPGGTTVSAHKCFATDRFVRPDWYTVLQLPRDPSIWILQVECCNTSLANMLCSAQCAPGKAGIRHGH